MMAAAAARERIATTNHTVGLLPCRELCAIDATRASRFVDRGHGANRHRRLLPRGAHPSGWRWANPHAPTVVPLLGRGGWRLAATGGAVRRMAMPPPPLPLAQTQQATLLPAPRAPLLGRAVGAAHRRLVGGGSGVGDHVRGCGGAAQTRSGGASPRQGGPRVLSPPPLGRWSVEPPSGRLVCMRSGPHRRSTRPMRDPTPPDGVCGSLPPPMLVGPTIAGDRAAPAPPTRQPSARPPPLFPPAPRQPDPPSGPPRPSRRHIAPTPPRGEVADAAAAAPRAAGRVATRPHPAPAARRTRPRGRPRRRVCPPHGGVAPRRTAPRRPSTRWVGGAAGRRARWRRGERRHGGGTRGGACGRPAPPADGGPPRRAAAAGRGRAATDGSRAPGD